MSDVKFKTTDFKRIALEWQAVFVEEGYDTNLVWTDHRLGPGRIDQQIRLRVFYTSNSGGASIVLSTAMSYLIMDVPLGGPYCMQCSWLKTDMMKQLGSHDAAH